MKFGMNLLLWTDDPTLDEFFPVLQKLKKMGYDGVELPMFHLDLPRWAALGNRGWSDLHSDHQRHRCQLLVRSGRAGC